MRGVARRGVRWVVVGSLLATACTTVVGLHPSVSAPGDLLTIDGTGFEATPRPGAAVLYDGQPIPIVSWSDTAVVASLPTDKPTGVYRVELLLFGARMDAGNHRLANLVLGAPVVAINPRNHLSALVSFESTVPATPLLEVSGPEGTWTVPASGVLTPIPATTHTVAVVGLRAGVTYTFTAKATAGAQTVTGPSITHRPAAFSEIAGFGPPPVQVTTAQPAAMQPGLTLFAATRVGLPSNSRIYAIDAAGNVVWYHQDPLPAPGDPFVPISRVRQLANGHILYLSYSISEIDLLGSEIDSFNVDNLGMDPAVDGPAHHDAIELPNGHLVALFAELRNVPGFKWSDGANCTTCRVVGDQLVEMTRDGQIVDRIHLFDLLDPHRTLLDLHSGGGESFNDASWNWWYGTAGGSTHDWTHCNALIHDPSDDSLIVSCRHQDLIAKISRATKQLVWVLGSDWPGSSGDDGWPFLEPAGPGIVLPLHQHGPFLKPNGNLLVYDNGNDRVPDEVTRQVEFVIDPVGGFLDVAWQWIDPAFDPPLFSYFAGNVEGEPNGNVLVTDGSLGSESTQWMRLSEVRPSDDVKVWEATIDDPSAQYSGLDAVRIPSLYPPTAAGRSAASFARRFRGGGRRREARLPFAARGTREPAHAAAVAGGEHQVPRPAMAGALVLGARGREGDPAPVAAPRGEVVVRVGGAQTAHAAALGVADRDVAFPVPALGHERDAAIGGRDIGTTGTRVVGEGARPAGGDLDARDLPSAPGMARAREPRPIAAHRCVRVACDRGVGEGAFGARREIADHQVPPDHAR